MNLKLKMIGVDSDLHALLKKGAARYSKLTQKHVSIREYIALALDELVNTAAENQRLKIENQQLKDTPLDEVYQEKLQIERVAIKADIEHKNRQTIRILE